MTEKVFFFWKIITFSAPLAHNALLLYLITWLLGFLSQGYRNVAQRIMSLVDRGSRQRRVCGHKCAVMMGPQCATEKQITKHKSKWVQAGNKLIYRAWRFQHDWFFFLFWIYFIGFFPLEIFCQSQRPPHRKDGAEPQRAVRLCCSPLPPEGAVATSLLLGSPAPKPLFSMGPTTGFSCQFSPNRFMAEREREQ